MKAAYRLILPALAVAALAACATMPEVDYDHMTDFASYHQFYWHPVKHQKPVKNPVLDSEILGRRVKNAVIDTLTARGYEQVGNADQADFIVTWQTASQQKLAASGGGFRFGVGIGYPFYSPFYGSAYWPIAPYNVESYQNGDLIIDIIDAASNELVWRGWTQARVRPSNFSRKDVKAMVKDILDAFPPRGDH
jgi:hypothetical protein